MNVECRIFLFDISAGFFPFSHKSHCVVYSISSVAETRDRALSFFLGKLGSAIHEAVSRYLPL